MAANIIFSVGKVYNFTKAEVKLGEVFSIELEDMNVQADGWYSNNDSVLSLSVQDNVGTCTANEVGKTFIKLFNGESQVKVLEIEVTSSVATSLNISAGNPEQK